MEKREQTRNEFYPGKTPELSGKLVGQRFNG